MADEKRVLAGGGAGGLHPLHDQTKRFQRGDQGGTDEHRSRDGPGGAPRGRSTEERRIPKEEDMLSNQISDGTTIEVGRGGICNTQSRGGHDRAANKSVSILDLPGDLASIR